MPVYPDLYDCVYGDPDKRPLVMVHGNGEDHTIFNEAASLLSEAFTVYTPDSPGHGQSYPVEEYHYESMAEAYIRYIERRELEKPVFYGFSDGGIIGLYIAIKRPDLLGQLIISGANTRPTGIYPRTYFATLVDYLRTGNPLAKIMLIEPNINYEELHRITVPTVVLAGEYDLIRPAHTRNIAKHIPNAHLDIIRGEDHGSYIIHSEQIAYLIYNYTH